MTLDEYLWKKRVHQRDFAVLIKASDSMVSAIRTGKRRPSVELAQRVEKATKSQVTAAEMLGLDTKKKAAKK